MKKIFDIIFYIIIALFIWLVISYLIINKIDINLFICIILFIFIFVSSYNLLEKEKIINDKLILSIIIGFDTLLIVIILYLSIGIKLIKISGLLLFIYFMIYNIIFIKFIYFIGKNRSKKNYKKN